MGKYSDMLIVSDIDGTLLGSDFKVSDKNRAALEKFKSGGGRFSLASGRSISDVIAIGSGLCNTCCIGFNGTVIGNSEGVSYACEFSDRIKETVRKIAALAPYSDVEFVTRNGIFVLNANEFTALHKSLVSDAVFEKICTLDELKNPVYMLAFWMHDSKIPQFAKLLKALGTDSEFNCFRGYKYSYEITPKSANKGTAAAKLKSMTNATRLFTVGDNENDLSLIDAADVSFAPKNAIELIKSVADVQLKSSADDSIFPEIIDYIDSNY